MQSIEGVVRKFVYQPKSNRDFSKIVGCKRSVFKPLHACGLITSRNIAD